MSPPPTVSALSLSAQVYEDLVCDTYTVLNVVFWTKREEMEAMDEWRGGCEVMDARIKCARLVVINMYCFGSLFFAHLFKIYFLNDIIKSNSWSKKSRNMTHIDTTVKSDFIIANIF